MTPAILKTGLVWMTALATLLAGTPHLLCRCPDGTLKPFCLAHVVQSKPCCQQKPGGTHETTPTCCQMVPPEEEPSDEPANSQTLPDQYPACSAVACQKTLVQPEAAASTRLEVDTLATALIDVAHDTALRHEIAEIRTIAGDSQVLPLQLTGLVILLRHLLI